MTTHAIERLRRRLAAMSIAAISCMLCATAQAGYIAVGATIRQVSNTGGNSTVFGMEIFGGTGPCTSATGTWVWFPLSVAPDADTHKRGYAAALLALATGMRITIHNYVDDQCGGAAFISVYN